MAVVLNDQFVRPGAGISDRGRGAKTGNRRALGRVAVVLILLASLLGRAGHAAAVEVVFPDSVLETDVREALGIPTGPITDADMASLESLESGTLMSDTNGVSHLHGLEYGVNLTSLDLASADFWYHRAVDLSPVAGLDKLEVLTLQGFEIGDCPSLAGLTGLASLVLSCSRISDLSRIGEIPNLEYLNVGGTDVIDPSTMAKLTNISELYLTWTPSGCFHDLTPISGLTNLTALYAAEDQITDITPIAGLVNLEVLDLSYNGLTDISPLVGMTKLKDLRLDNTLRVKTLDMTGFSLTSLHTFSCDDTIYDVSLRNVTLNQTAFNALMNGGEVVDEVTQYACGIAELKNGYGEYDVRTLDLGGIDFADITDLSKMYTADGIEELSFAGVTNLDGDQVVALTSELDSLNWLDVRGPWETFDTPTRQALKAWDAIEGNTLVTVPEPGMLCLLAGLVVLAGRRERC